MDRWALLVALAGVIALTLQGASCLLSDKRPFSLGVLDIALAGILAFVTLSLYSGQLVLGSEFGAVMIQGTWPSRFLRLALIGVAALPPLCLSRIRGLNKWKSHPTLMLLTGIAVGLWAATRVDVLNVTDPTSHQVYLYDVWWPPLIVWFSVCFAGCVLALIEAEPTAVLIAFAAALVTPLAIFALRIEDLPDPQSRPGWLALERIGFTAALLILAYTVLKSAGLTRGRLTRPILLYAVGPAIALGLWFWLGTISTRSRAILGPLPLLLFAVGLALAIIDQVSSKPATSEPTQPPPEPPRLTPLRSLSQVIPVSRLRGIVHSLAVPLIAVCIVDLFSIGYANRALELFVALSLWLLFAERLAEGALDNLPRLVKDGVLQTATVKYLWAAVTRCLAASRRLTASGRRFFTTGKPWTLAFKAILVPIVIMSLLTIATELFNYDKTVVQPFHWAAGGDPGEEGTKRDQGEAIARTFTEGVINALGRMRQDLRTDLILAQRTSSGEHPTDVRQFDMGADANGSETAVAKSDELKFGGVSVPVSVFISPLQHLVRSWLTIRSVSGRLQKSPGGGYVAWVNSSYGESWRRTSGTPPLNHGAPSDSGSLPQQASSEEEGALAGSQGCETESADKPGSLDELIEQVAFDVARTDRSFIAAGMTSSWPAFQHLRDGLRHWDRYERQQDSRELAKAVGCFRAAVREDGRFVLANYRYGVALLEDGRPRAAIQAFRDSRMVNPDFTPAVLKEADTLDDLNRYYPDQPAAAASLPANGLRLEAKRLWIGLTSPPERQLSLAERRTAYYGLCGAELEEAKRTTGSTGFLPYYYCSRALALSYHMTAGERLRLTERLENHQILNTLGVSLEIHRHQQRRDLLAGKPEAPWVCSTGAFGPDDPREDGSVSKIEVWGTARSRAALDYYRSSLGLVPDSDAVRCNAAIGQAYVYGDMEPMKRLAEEAGPRISMGNDLQTLAHDTAEASVGEGDDSARLKQKATGYYRRALTEYSAAIDVDRTAVEALLGYAFAVWGWEVDWLADRTSAPPEQALAMRGERHVRAALRLARFRQGEARLELLGREALGEILLAQGRTEEAIDRLKEAVDVIRTVNPRWGGANETHWDLALAELCTCRDKQDGDCREHSQRAIEQLEGIWKSEQDLEQQPFSDDQATLDPIELRAQCPSSPDGTPGRELSFTMREPRYGRGPGCSWLGVEASLNKPDPSTEYSLHIWGGGVDKRIDVGSGPRQSVQLESQEKSTSAYYFAQLERKDGEPVSRTRAFATHGTREKDACSHNLVQLTFDRRMLPQIGKG